MIPPEKALLKSNLTSLKFLHRGKVRDIYAVDENKLLIIQTDRLSDLGELTKPFTVLAGNTHGSRWVDVRMLSKFNI